MSQYVIWSREDVEDFDCACKLLMSASCCIGVRDQVAQELVGDVLNLLRGIVCRSAPDLEPTTASRAGFH
jgi:hypothetical protein